MSQSANPLRGETSIKIGTSDYVLRPSFENLILAEEELGSLFALVERASSGSMTIAEMAGLIWHCIPDSGRPSRQDLGAALLAMGLVNATKPVRTVLAQVLQGKT